MDWIAPAAERIRTILAQQAWLDAWRPTIDATPDWALLTAGPAALLVLLLLIRVSWPRASKARLKRQADAEAAARSQPAPLRASSPPAPAPAASAPPQTASARPADTSLPPPRAPAIVDEQGSASLLARDGKRPDAVLRCTIQTGDNDSAEFLDGLVGAYREDRFLRILMQNDEPDDPSDYWRSWDVPWSQIVQIILRRRTTPTVHTNVRQADGAYALRGPYLQTRVYKIGRGMECRLLDRDDPESDAPFAWLKSHLDDPEIRFGEDTQENALYGDTTAKVVGDSLDEYALRLKSRSTWAEDKAFSHKALALADEELAKLRMTAPQTFPGRNFSPLKDPSLNAAPKDLDSLLGEFDRWYAELVGEPAESLATALRDYARTVVERLLLGAIRPQYYALFFYENFPANLDADGTTKSKLLQIVRWMRPGGGLGY